MNEKRQILDQQLKKWEAQRESLEVTIAEIHRRFSVLDDVESWDHLAPEEISQENGMDHLSAFGDQEVESSEEAVQEEEDPELKLGSDMEATQTFDSNGRPLRARDMFKRQTLQA